MQNLIKVVHWRVGRQIGEQLERQITIDVWHQARRQTALPFARQVTWQVVSNGYLHASARLIGRS